MRKTLAIFLGLITLFYVTLPRQDIAPRQPISAQVLDKNGVLLRAFTASDERWRLPANLRDIDENYVKLLTSFEDKRFFTHWGFDPRAFTRAMWQNVKAGRIVSGGSTLTMQTVRLLKGENTRGVWGKSKQIYFAFALEKHYSKQEILTLYMNLAPFGGNIEGLRAATLHYFGREPRRLSMAEAAILVALPQSPKLRRVSESKLKQARNMVLAAGYTQKIYDYEDFNRALLEKMPQTRHAMPMLAPQYADQFRGEAVTRTSIDAKLQARLETHVREYVNGLDKQISVAIIVADNKTGAVRASIGGVDYFSKERAGAMDLTGAVRSPGSALKPFIYGFAFDNGIAHPETLLDDKPTRYGFWAPENFDHGFTGQVTARHALQQSLNLPAVELLSLLGSQRFLARLRTGELHTILPKNSDTGLAVGLGGLGLTLKDLVTGFTAIARGGEGVALKNLEAQQMRILPALFSPESAWYLHDILKGASPPHNAPAQKLAFKTGTSYGYRDAWSVGFDKSHTIGVWVGRADNASVPGLVGRSIAAPLLFDAFAFTGFDPTPFIKPIDALVAKSADLPPPLKMRRSDSFEKEAPLKLVFPPDGARLEVADIVNIKITGGTAPYIYLVNDVPIEEPTARKSREFKPQSQGFIRISVIDKMGQTSSAQVRLD